MLRRFARHLLPQAQQILGSVDAYALWAEQYPAKAHNVLMQAEQDAMLSVWPDVTGRVVLDLACGTGRYGLIAGSAGARCVIGVDNSAAMLKRAEIGALALAETRAIPLVDFSVDVVVCGLALGHTRELAPTMREISRVLRPGGVALISDFHPFLALSGAQRTFTTSDGQTYAVEHYAHLYSDYHRTAMGAGLFVDAVIEPTIGDNEVPAVLVLRLIKRQDLRKNST